jgi:hypothetical protein
MQGLQMRSLSMPPEGSLSVPLAGAGGIAGALLSSASMENQKVVPSGVDRTLSCAQASDPPRRRNVAQE